MSSLMELVDWRRQIKDRQGRIYLHPGVWKTYSIENARRWSSLWVGWSGTTSVMVVSTASMKDAKVSQLDGWMAGERPPGQGSSVWPGSEEHCVLDAHWADKEWGRKGSGWLGSWAAASAHWIPDQELHRNTLDITHSSRGSQWWF